MSVLTESYEVWLPMPYQDPELPAGQKRYWLLRTVTNEGDALAIARDAAGAAVTKTTFPQGTRTVVLRP